MTDLVQRIKPGNRIFLFLDYDGTLVPIKRTPEMARLHPLRRQFLKSLGKKMSICIVSGRSLAEIQRLVAIEGIGYVGNHGLEISFNQRIWVHPEAKKIRPVLQRTLKKIQSKTRHWPGVLVEDKGLTGSIHYRRLPSAYWLPLKKIIQTEVGSRGKELRLTSGKRVFEIRPNLDWNKGSAIVKLLRGSGVRDMPLLIYIGDDQTDEDAFRRLGKKDVTIRVGRKKTSQAYYRLVDVNHVWRFLKKLFDLKSRPKTAILKKPSGD